MDMIEVREKIEKKIEQLEIGRMELRKLAYKKSETLVKYRKEKAKIIIRIRNGEIFKLDGFEVVNPPATLISNIAQGICWQEKLEADTAEGLYSVAVKGIDALKAELNGLQSIHKYEA